MNIIFAAIFALFDPNSAVVTNRVTQVLVSQETSTWINNPNALMNPQFPTNGTVADWKVLGTNIVEMTAQEKANIAAAELATRLAAEKLELMIALNNERERNRIMLESLVVLLVSQFNAVRTNNAVLPAVTISQARNAILTEYTNRVNALEAQ